MRITVLAIAAVVLGVSAPASAADLVSAPLRSAVNGNGVKCTATNKGPTGDITVRIRIRNNFPGVVCDLSDTLGPGEELECISTLDSVISHCRVTTSSASKTRALFMTLDSNGDATATDVPR